MIYLCLLLQRGNSYAKIKNRHVTKDGIEAYSSEEILVMFLSEVGLNLKVSNPELCQTCLNGVKILLTEIITFIILFKHYNDLKT
jgi:hypothetical protein